MNSKNDGKKAEQVRKLIGAALCDFIGALAGSKDPFIVGGQYSKERILVEFRAWLQDRNFNIAGTDASSEQWVNLCKSHAFSGREGDDRTPVERSPPPLPEAKPPKSKPPTSPPHGVGEQGPEDGFLNGDEWKAKEDRKDRWQDEGEDWKKGKENDE